MSVRYTGKLASNGKIFDQTKGKKTFAFRIGASPSLCLTIVGTADTYSVYLTVNMAIRRVKCMPSCF